MFKAFPIYARRLRGMICGKLACLLPEKIPECLVNLYDGYSRQAFDKYYLEVAGQIVGFCPNGRILDVGCGPGYLAVQVARLSEYTRIDGVDLSPGMVNLATKCALEYGVEKRVRFVVGNGNALNCPAAHYDMVVSTGVLHSLKNPVQFLDECFRVLKPGGETWIYDPAKITSGVDNSGTGIGQRWAAVIVYHGMKLLARLFQQGNLSEKDLVDTINRSRFSEYSISFQGDIRIKLKKGVIPTTLPGIVG